jgi:hypothetical protein
VPRIVEVNKRIASQFSLLFQHFKEDTTLINSYSLEMGSVQESLAVLSTLGLSLMVIMLNPSGQKHFIQLSMHIGVQLSFNMSEVPQVTDYPLDRGERHGILSIG